VSSRTHNPIGRDALHGQGGQHDGHDRIGRNAERQGRDEAGLAGGIRRRLGRDDAFDGAMPEAPGIPRHLLLDRIAHDRRQHRPGARQQAEPRPNAGAAQDRAP
jgi:hypothetical protein